MDVKLNLTKDEHKELVAYCNLNDLLISSVVKDSFTTGFNIERYGLLNSNLNKEKIVEKEVIKEKRVEIPFEVIKEVVKIEYVEIEKPIEKIVDRVVEKPIEVIKEVPVERVIEKIVEIIKEVPVEKVIVQEVVKEIPVEKIVKVSDDTQINELLNKIQQLENTPPKIIEVIKEIPVEKVVIQEKVVEVIKEIPVEKVVTQEIIIEKEVAQDNNKIDALQKTIYKLRQENMDKERVITELNKTIENIQLSQEEKKAVYLRGSNLDDKLYK